MIIPRFEVTTRKVECTEDMFRNGQYFYDLSDLEPVAAPARGEI